MYDSKKHAQKTSRLRGFEEFLSSEQDAVAEEESAALTPTEQEPTAAVAKAKKATGKRALTAEETGRYEKQAKRRLIVDPPTQDERGSKLMESAFRTAPPVLLLEEEPQESSVGGISHQAGLRSMGPALVGEVSSYHPPDEEGGDETGMGDAESAPTTVPDDTAPAKDFAKVGDEPAGGSISSSALLPILGASSVSPTTGLLPQPTASESQEKVDYEDSEDGGDNEDDKDDEDDGDDGDDEDDEINEAWDTLPVSSPGKASAYTPISLSESPIEVVTPVPNQLEAFTSPPDQQAVVTSAVATSPLMKSMPLVISLRPTHETTVSGPLPVGAFTAPPSSPSTLGFAVPSAASSPASSVAVMPQPVTSVVTSSSPVALFSPADIPDLLEMFVKQLGQMMQKAVTAVSAGRCSFEPFKSLLLNYLNNIERMGDVECTKRCSESILCLERDLKVLQDLNRIDLEARIESTFVEVRSQAMHRYEVVQKNIFEREARVASSKTQCEYWQTELTSTTSAMQATKEAITRLQAELAQQEANVRDLTRKSVEAYNEYCREVQALEEIKKGAEAAAPDEEELKKEAAAVVRAAYEQEIAEVEARLVSITQRGH